MFRAIFKCEEEEYEPYGSWMSCRLVLRRLEVRYRSGIITPGDIATSRCVALEIVELSYLPLIWNTAYCFHICSRPLSLLIKLMECWISQTGDVQYAIRAVE